MSERNTKSRSGTVSKTYLLLATVIGCASVGSLVLYQAYSMEKSALLHKIDRAVQERGELNTQLEEVTKAIQPLKAEVAELKNSIAPGGRTYGSRAGQAPNLPKRGAEELRQLRMSIEREGSGRAGSLADNVQERTEMPSAISGNGPSAERNIFKLRDYVKSIEEQNGLLKAKVGLLSKTLFAKERDLVKVEKESAVLREELSAAKKSQGDLRSEFDQGMSLLRAQLSQKEVQFADLTVQKQRADNEIRELSSKLAVLNERSTLLEKQSSQGRQDKTSLEIEHTKVKADLAREAAYSDALRNQVRELTRSLRTKEVDRIEMTKRLVEVDLIKKNLEAEAAELRSGRAAYESRIGELTQRVQEFTSSYENIRGTVAQIAELLSRKEEAINEKQSEIASIRESLAQEREDKERLLAELKEKMSHILQLNGELKGTEFQMQTLQSELGQAEERQKRTVRELGELSSMNSALLEKISTVSREIETTKAISLKMPDEMKGSDETYDIIEVKSYPDGGQ